MLQSSRPHSQMAFHAALEEYRLLIDRELSKELNRHVNSAFHFPLKNSSKGGKRIRPILLILAHKTIKGKEVSKAYPAAIAIELAHLESLIHDDIIDKDAERRKSASFHVLYGHEMAILSADFILSIILRLTSSYKGPRIPRTLAEATSRMGDGELEDFRVCDGNQTITSDKYLDIVRKKTASLFEASATIGTMIAGATKKDTDALAEYGRLVGTAYQIQDDIADLDKRTRINILALASGNEISIEQLKVLSLECIRNAKSGIEKLKDNEAKQLLIDLADSVAFSSM